MFKSFLVSAMLVCSVLFAACTDPEADTGALPGQTPEGSVASRFCERGDECNLLSGKSVDECTEDVESILADATPSQRKEIEFDLEKCLERPTCGGFADCLGL